MTTLAEGRPMMLEQYPLDDDLDEETYEYRLKIRAQIMAVMTGPHPYHTFWFLVGIGSLEPYESLEHHPIGAEICWENWDDQAASTWTKDYDERRKREREKIQQAA